MREGTAYEYPWEIIKCCGMLRLYPYTFFVFISRHIEPRYMKRARETRCAGIKAVIFKKSGSFALPEAKLRELCSQICTVFSCDFNMRPYTDLISLSPEILGRVILINEPFRLERPTLPVVSFPLL